MSEYKEVLARKKFNFDQDMIGYVLSAIDKFGILIYPGPTEAILPDLKDIPFYEIVMETRENDSYLVTGNIKHFTKEEFI